MFILIGRSEVRRRRMQDRFRPPHLGQFCILASGGSWVHVELLETSTQFTKTPLD
jgi:hypothetical protein